MNTFSLPGKVWKDRASRMRVVSSWDFIRTLRWELLSKKGSVSACSNPSFRQKTLTSGRSATTIIFEGSFPVLRPEAKISSTSSVNSAGNIFFLRPNQLFLSPFHSVILIGIFEDILAAHVEVESFKTFH